MRKEFMLAIAFGVLIGICAMALFFIKRQGTPLPTSSPISSVTSQITPTPTQNLDQQKSFTINLPPVGAVIDGSLTISGTTNPDYWVVAYNDTISYVTKANSDGSFSMDFVMDSLGLNSIKIASVDPNTNSTETQQVVVFNTATKASTFLTGSITDITDSGLQLAKSEVVYPDDQKNEIALVSFTSDTNYYNEDEVIEFSDLGIADFVVVLGQADDTGVLDAQEIVVVTEPIEGTSSLLAGNLTLSDDELIMQNSGEDYLLEADNSTEYLVFNDGEFTSQNDLDEGQYLAFVVGENLGTIFEPAAIYVLK